MRLGKGTKKRAALVAVLSQLATSARYQDKAAFKQVYYAALITLYIITGCAVGPRVPMQHAEDGSLATRTSDDWLCIVARVDKPE